MAWELSGPPGETEPQLWEEVRIGSGDITGVHTPVASTGDSRVQSD